jgi:hypothetical protein
MTATNKGKKKPNRLKKKKKEFVLREKYSCICEIERKMSKENRKVADSSLRFDDNKKIRPICF